MADIEDLQSWVGAEIVDPDDAKVGKLDELFLDARTGVPTYGLAKSGLMGRRHAFPLDGASFSRGHIRTGFSRDLVTSSPAVGDRTISYGDQVTLIRHYGLTDDTSPGQPDEVRLVSTTAMEARRQKIESELQRADDLEQQAVAHDQAATELMSTANEQARLATEAAAERDRLAAEAAAVRARAERNAPPDPAR